MAGVYNGVIEQGATFSLSLTCSESVDSTPLPIGDYVIEMQLRKGNYLGEVAITLSTVDGTLVVANDTLYIVIEAVDTAKLLNVPYVYDIEMTKDGVVKRLLQGTLSVSPEVTR